MPELPEVETVRRGLEPHLEGSVLQQVRCFRENLRKPFPDDFVTRLQGQRIGSVNRQAKFLLLGLSSGETLISHLGMSGKYRIFTSEPPALEKHDHVEWVTDKGVTIRYNDPRRFGLMDLIETTRLDDHPMLKGLGPEPNGNFFGPDYLKAALKGRGCTIKDALMNQKIVAGLGNIYVCEALYRAGISPKKKASTIKGERADRLAGAIREVINEAIESGGSSLKDYVQTNGEMGYFQHAFQVYGRAGEPCFGCRSPIRRIVQAGRSTFYCAKEQR